MEPGLALFLARPALPYHLGECISASRAEFKIYRRGCRGNGAAKRRQSTPSPVAGAEPARGPHCPQPQGFSPRHQLGWGPDRTSEPRPARDGFIFNALYSKAGDKPEVSSRPIACLSLCALALRRARPALSDRPRVSGPFGDIPESHRRIHRFSATAPPGPAAHKETFSLIEASLGPSPPFSTGTVNLYSTTGVYFRAYRVFPPS